MSGLYPYNKRNCQSYLMQRKLSSMCILLDWFPEDVIKGMENLYVVFMHNVTYLWWITPKKVCKSRLLKGGEKGGVDVLISCSQINVIFYTHYSQYSYTNLMISTMMYSVFSHLTSKLSFFSLKAPQLLLSRAFISSRKHRYEIQPDQITFAYSSIEKRETRKVLLRIFFVVFRDYQELLQIQN